MCPVYKGMLDPIITSYKLTTIVSVTYNKIQQYPVRYIYNTLPVLRDGFQMQSEVNVHIHFRCTLKIKYPLLYCSCVKNYIFDFAAVLRILSFTNFIRLEMLKNSTQW